MYCCFDWNKNTVLLYISLITQWHFLYKKKYFKLSSFNAFFIYMLCMVIVVLA